MSLEAATAAPEAPASPPPVSGAPASAPEKAAPDPQAAERALDDDLRKVFRNANRERGEDGKFAGKEPKEAAPKLPDGAPALKAEVKTETAKPVEAKADVKTAEVKAPEAQKAPAVEAPKHWNESVRTAFAALPPEAQKALADQGLQDRQTVSRLGNQLKQIEPVAKVIEEHQDTFARNQLSPDKGIKALLSAQQMLDRDPVAGLKWLAQNYGVQAQFGGEQQADGLPPDPHVAQLQNEVAQLKRQLAETSHQARMRMQAETAAQQQTVMRQIQEFAKDKPDFETLAPHILSNLDALLQSNPGKGHADLLAEAYEAAGWAHPETRKTRLERQERERVAEMAKAAELAKSQAAVNIQGAPKKGEGLGMDDDLRSIWRKNNSK